MDHTIFTLVAASKLELFCADVLIVAMGGNWAFDLPRFMSAVKQPTLVIDIVDDFDEVALDASQSRLQAYDGRDWTITAGSKWKALCPRQQA